MKRIIAIFYCTMMVMTSSAQEQIEASIDTMNILIGQQSHLTVAVTIKEGTPVSFPTYKRTEFITPGVEVLSQSDGDTTSLDDGWIKVTKTFTLTSFDERLYSIPGMKVKVGGKTLTANQLALKVLTVDVDTVHPNKFYPPKDVQDNPFLWSDMSGIFWLSCLMILLCVICAYLYIRLKQNKPVFVNVITIKHIPAHQKALADIEKIKSERMTVAEKPKEYYTKLTLTLRRYIEERFGFNAMEMTSDEIINKLKEAGDKEMINELKNLFETADLVKFAKYLTLINENDINLVNAIKFIDTTKQNAKVTEEKIVPKLSEEEMRTASGRKYLKASIFVLLTAISLLIIYISYRFYLLMN